MARDPALDGTGLRRASRPRDSFLWIDGRQLGTTVLARPGVSYCVLGSGGFLPARVSASHCFHTAVWYGHFSNSMHH